MQKSTIPEFGLKSFSCPHCHALAHQIWYSAFASYLKNPPRVIDRDEVESLKRDHLDNPKMENLIKWAERQLNRSPFINSERSSYNGVGINHLNVSQCHSCSGITVWVFDQIVYPQTKLDIVPNPYMPLEAAVDFQEAATIFNLSPKGAAALLRLALQKMLIALGENGTRIDADIGSLVRKGLPAQVQQALDVVRVTGNHLVHPGQIDSADTREAALRLFGLLNIITEAMITQPRQIKEMFGELPSGALEAIERRDKPKELSPPDGKKG